MADEDRPPLTSTEAAHVEQQQAVERAEAQTGTEPVQRTMATEEPTTLDPRFDRDDLRQGKPPPAAKKRRLRIRRQRKAKGKPLTAEEKRQAATDPGDGAGAGDADMTDEEVDLTDDESSIHTAADHEDREDGKKHGLIGKIIGKDKD